LFEGRRRSNGRFIDKECIFKVVVALSSLFLGNMRQLP
jgi:hypothetical protein